MNGYIAFYDGRRAEFYDETLYGAKKQAVIHFKVRRNREHMVSIHLAEKDAEPGKPGTPVVHVADF